MLRAVQEGNHLTSGAGILGRESSVTGAGSDTILHRPQHGLIVVVPCKDIPKGILHGVGRRLAHGAPQEGDHLRSGTGIVGRELAAAGTGGDAVVHRPQHGLIVIRTRIHIHEGIVIGLGSGLAHGTPQEGDHLCSGAGILRGELAVAGTGGDTILHRPQHGCVEVIGFRHIHEGILIYRTTAAAVQAVPGVTQRIGVSIHPLRAAEDTGKGGEAALGTGGFGDGLRFLVAVGRNDLLLGDDRTAVRADNAIGQTGFRTGGITAGHHGGVRMAAGVRIHEVERPRKQLQSPVAGLNLNGLPLFGGAVEIEVHIHTFQIVESILFNPLQGIGQVQFLQTVQRMEGVHTDDLHAGFDDHRFQSVAVAEQTLRDLRDGAGNGDSFQAPDSAEHIRTDAGDVFSEDNLLKGGAAGEDIAAGLRNVRIDEHLFQICKFAEYTAAQLLKSCRQAQLCQTAPFKGSIIDFFQPLGELNLGQVGAPAECIRADVFQRLRQRHIGQRNAVKEGVLFDGNGTISLFMF